MVRDMPDEKAKEVTGDLQALVTEASKDQTRRKWYELSGEVSTEESLFNIINRIFETVIQFG